MDDKETPRWERVLWAVLWLEVIHRILTGPESAREARRRERRERRNARRAQRG